MAAHRFVSERACLPGEGLSRLTDAGMSSFVNQQICNTADKFLLDLLWKNSRYAKKSVAVNTYDNGGQCFLDFLNNPFKMNWITQRH